MKPVGIERDKEIAELKEICYHEWNPLPEIDKGYLYKMYKCKNCGGRQLKQYENKNWSTSWNDAKELWDELPTSRMFLESAKPPKGIDRNSCVINYKSEYIEGKDFPDAVSQAWIKYKEVDDVKGR